MNDVSQFLQAKICVPVFALLMMTKSCVRLYMVERCSALFGFLKLAKHNTKKKPEVSGASGL